MLHTRDYPILPTSDDACVVSVGLSVGSARSEMCLAPGSMLLGDLCDRVRAHFEALVFGAAPTSNARLLVVADELTHCLPLYADDGSAPFVLADHVAGIVVRRVEHLSFQGCWYATPRGGPLADATMRAANDAGIFTFEATRVGTWVAALRPHGAVVRVGSRPPASARTPWTLQVSVRPSRAQPCAVHEVTICGMALPHIAQLRAICVRIAHHDGIDTSDGDWQMVTGGMCVPLNSLAFGEVPARTTAAVRVISIEPSTDTVARPADHRFAPSWTMGPQTADGADRNVCHHSPSVRVGIAAPLARGTSPVPERSTDDCVTPDSSFHPAATMPSPMTPFCRASPAGATTPTSALATSTATPTVGAPTTADDAVQCFIDPTGWRCTCQVCLAAAAAEADEWAATEATGRVRHGPNDVDGDDDGVSSEFSLPDVAATAPPFGDDNDDEGFDFDADPEELDALLRPFRAALNSNAAPVAFADSASGGHAEAVVMAAIACALDHSPLRRPHGGEHEGLNS